MMAKIINSSFEEEALPTLWKEANITPVPKQPIIEDMSKHLRPISLTSTLSIVAEDFVVRLFIKPAILGELSMAQIPMNEIQKWSSTNKFQLHPSKCKELCISFTCIKRDHTPVIIENNTVELVKSLKILGLTVQDDLRLSSVSLQPT